MEFYTKLVATSIALTQGVCSQNSEEYHFLPKIVECMVATCAEGKLAHLNQPQPNVARDAAQALVEGGWVRSWPGIGVGFSSAEVSAQEVTQHKHLLKAGGFEVGQG